MDSLVLVVVLAAAAMHASWNALVKTGGDPHARLAIVNLTHTVAVLPFLPFVAVPDAAAWPWLLGSVATHLAYYVFLATSYRLGDLSHVYPIARGVAPPLVALGGFVLAGESIPLSGLLAIGAVCLGIWVLALSGRAAGSKPLLAALATGSMIAAYTLCDGLGGRASGPASGDVAGYIVYLFLLDGWPFGLFLLARRGRALLPAARRALVPAVGGGLLSCSAYALVIWAMSKAPLAYVSALRETSVVLAAIIGALLLHEPFGRKRVLSAAVVASGVAVLQLTR